MATYKHENISIDVDTIDERWVDHLGETYMELSHDFIAELLENHCNFFEWFYQDEGYEVYQELDEDIDKFIEHYKSSGEKIMEVRNADAIIAVYEYCLDFPDKQFNFTVRTENITWVIHDLLHAVHDAAGCTITVAAEAEKARIYESFEICAEHFPNLLPSFEFIENLETEFFNRFKSHLDLEQYKYN